MEDRKTGDVVTADSVDAIVDQWKRQLPDMDASPLLVLGRLQRVVSRCEPLLRPPFAAAGLANGDFDVLAALRRTDAPHALSPGQLGEAMLVTSGAVTKRVDRLERAGLVSRTSVAHDARERRVTLTDVGLSLAERLMRAHLDNEAAILNLGLDADEQVVLAGLLQRLLSAVESTGRRGDA